MKRPALEQQEIIAVKKVIRDLFFSYRFAPVHKMDVSKQKVLLEERKWLKQIEETFNREINRNRDTKLKLLLEDLYGEYLNKIDEEKEDAEVESERSGDYRIAVEEEQRVYENITNIQNFEIWTRHYLREMYQVPEDFYNRSGSVFYSEAA